ncbi:hypothetical protein cypCar_00042146, partial [Cyprinus carpio]
SRRGNAPPAPPQKATAPTYNREKPLPPTPGQRGSSPAPVRENAPPPPVKPPPSPASSRLSSSSSSSLAPPPPPYRQQSGVSNGPSSPVNEAAPELPQRHNSLSKKPSAGGHTPTRGHAPPPPPSPTPHAARPPPPVREPPGRGADDFESKYSFHPLDDFPPPEEYRHFTKIYPSKANRGKNTVIFDLALMCLCLFGSNERSPSFATCWEVNTVTSRWGCIGDEGSSYRPIRS